MPVHQPPSQPVPRAVSIHPEPGLLALSVWTERKPGQGEDAEPLVLHHRPTGSGMLAVFDGAGGAGSGPAWQDSRGQTRTGAWVGSRVARLGVESWFAHHILDHEAADADSLGNHLRWLFGSVPAPARSKVVGRMRKHLPTTLAGLHYAVLDDEVTCEALWAGDSRAYVLTADGGLRALTRDHTVETDALSQLVQDPQMTNMLCADQDFFVQSHWVSASRPCVLLCATDGFFGYVHTPGDFEHMLLSTLHHSTGPGDWSRHLTRTVEAYTADDASLALAAVGYPDFHHLREQFEPRYRQIDQLSGSMPDPDDLAAIRQWRQDCWTRYRPGYEQWMPPILDDGEDS